MCFWGNVYYIVLEVLSSRGNEIRVYRLSKSLEKDFHIACCDTANAGGNKLSKVDLVYIYTTGHTKCNLEKMLQCYLHGRD